MENLPFKGLTNRCRYLLYMLLTVFVLLSYCDYSLKVILGTTELYVFFYKLMQFKMFKIFSCVFFF